MTNISRALIIVLFSAVIATAQTKPADEGWPRRFALGTNSAAVYQPQIEEWSGNSLSARAAIGITESQSKQQIYGVLWFSARAEIDKVNRLVTLSEFKVKKLSLPMAPDKAAAFEAAFQARADKQVNVIALDRLLARERFLTHRRDHLHCFPIHDRKPRPQRFMPPQHFVKGSAADSIQHAAGAARACRWCSGVSAGKGHECRANHKYARADRAR